MKLAWSYLAIGEMQALRRLSVRRCGQDVAQRYVEDVRDAAKALSVDPLRARPLRGSLRLLRVQSHYLIVQVDVGADRLVIARVLHVAMDIERYLP